MEISNDEYLNRTNNLLERYHGILNQQLEFSHPKLSYLIDKYKINLVNIYNRMTLSLINVNNVKEERLSIINDIYSFFAIYNSKYKTNIQLSNILQSDEEIIKIIDKICNFILDFLFDGFNSEDIDNIEDKDNQGPDNPNDNESDLENESDNEITSNNENIFLKDYINFNDFYPKITKKKEKEHTKKLLEKIMKLRSSLNI